MKSLRKDNGTLSELPTKPAPKTIGVPENNNADTTEKVEKSPKQREPESEPKIVRQSMQNQFSKVEKNKTTDTVEKNPIPLRTNVDTDPGISTEPAQNQSSKAEKKPKVLTQ